MPDGNGLFRTIGRTLQSLVRCVNSFSPGSVSVSAGQVMILGGNALSLPYAAPEVNGTTTLKSIQLTEKCATGSQLKGDIKIIFLDAAGIAAQGSAFSVSSGVNVLGIVNVVEADYKVEYDRSGNRESIARVTCDIPMRCASASNTVYACLVAAESLTFVSSHVYTVEGFFLQ